MVFERARKEIAYHLEEARFKLLVKPSMSLTNRLFFDFYQAAAWTEATFDNFEWGFDFIDPKERSRIKRYGEHVHANVNPVTKSIEERVGEDLPFNIENISALNHIYNKLETTIPDGEKTQELIDQLEASLGNSSIGDSYDTIKKLLPFSGAISGISALGAGVLGAYGAAGVYLSSFISSAKASIDDKSPPWQALWANFGIWAGYMTTAAELLVQDDLRNGPHVRALSLGLNALAFIATPLAPLTYKYMKAGRPIKEKIRYLKRSRSELDSLLRHGIVLEEARRNLRAVNKSIKRGNGNAEETETQIANVERVLKRYLDGKSSYDDVINARISYTNGNGPSTQPSVVPRIQVPQAPTSTKVKYTAEEHAELRRRREVERAQQGIIRRPLNEPVVRTSIGEDYTESTITVGLSEWLQGAYRRGRLRIGGSNIVPLVDTTKSKIENNPNGGERVRKTTDGRYLIDRLTSRHGLSPEATIYKMRPTGGGIRAFYVRDGDKITVLDIMTHEEYDFQMKKK